MKYKLGDTVYYVESHTRYQKSIPCPLCFGKKYVTVILGDDSRVNSLCGACDRGIECATGTTTTWEPQAFVHAGEITGISTKDGIKYEVGRSSFFEHELYEKESEAEIVRQVKFDEAKETADRWYKESFVTSTKKQTWSVSYHQRNIKDHERQIEWHKYRLEMIKEKDQPK